MAIPNLRNRNNVYPSTPITPIREPPAVPSDLVTPAVDSSLPPQSHRQRRPPPTKAVLKATWLNCEDCVQKTKTMIKEIAPVQGIQHLRIDPKNGVIEVEGSIDAHWLASFLAGQFKRNVKVLTEDDQNKGKDKEGSSSVGDQEDTEETDKTLAYTSIERVQVHHSIKEQNNLGSINGYQQKFSDDVKADSDLQQPPTLPDVNLPNSISSPQSPPTQPPNPDSYMVSPMREVVLKAQLHCEGCSNKLKNKLSKIKGVAGVQIVNIIDEEKLIKVQGTMDTKVLPAYLMKKLNLKVEVVEVVLLQPKRHTS